MHRKTSKKGGEEDRNCDGETGKSGRRMENNNKTWKVLETANRERERKVKNETTREKTMLTSPLTTRMSRGEQ